MKPTDLRRSIQRYAIFHPTKLLATKLDETQTLGSVFSEAVRTGLALSFLTHGPAVPGDIRAASVEDLVGMALTSETARAEVRVEELMATPSSLAYTENADRFAPKEREELIIEHLPQVRWIASRIHERLPENTRLKT